MLGSTSKFRVHDVIYNKGGFAIARGYWEDSPTLNLACRWHEEGEIGYPQTFGKPQWMQFPSEDVNVEITNTLDPSATKVTIVFN